MSCNKSTANLVSNISFFRSTGVPCPSAETLGDRRSHSATISDKNRQTVEIGIRLLLRNSAARDGRIRQAHVRKMTMAR